MSQTIQNNPTKILQLLKRAKCTGDSQYCETPSTITSVQIAMAVVIPLVVIGIVVGFFAWKAYRKNRKEALEDDDPDFNGDNTVLPDYPTGPNDFYEYENPFENPHNNNNNSYSMHYMPENATSTTSIKDMNNSGRRMETFVLPYQNETANKQSLENLAKALGTDSGNRAQGGYRIESPIGMYRGKENPYATSNNSRKSSISLGSRPLTAYDSNNVFSRSEVSLQKANNSTSNTTTSPLHSQNNSPSKILKKSPLGNSNQEEDEDEDQDNLDLNLGPQMDDEDDIVEDHGMRSIHAVSESSPIKSRTRPSVTETNSSIGAEDYHETLSHVESAQGQTDQDYANWASNQANDQEKAGHDYSFDRGVNDSVVYNNNDVNNNVTESPFKDQPQDILEDGQDGDVPDLKTILDDDKYATISPEEEEQINRMKSVYKVYFSRENSKRSVRSTANVAQEFTDSDMPPLPNVEYDQPTDQSLEQNVTRDRYPVKENVEDVESRYNYNDENNQNYRDSLASSVYNVNPNQSQNYHPQYPHQQMQGYIDQAHYQRQQQQQQQQYDGGYYGQPQQQQQQPMYYEQQNPYRQPVYPQQRRKAGPLKKLENLPSPYELSNRNSTLQDFTEFERGKKFQDKQSPSMNQRPFNPIDHDEVWSANGNQQPEDPYQKTVTLPHHIRDSIVMINPVDLNKPQSYRPAGSFQQVTRNVSTNSSSSINLPGSPSISTSMPKSPSIIQQNSPIFGVSNGFERPHAPENLVPHSGSQSDLRKYMGYANV